MPEICIDPNGIIKLLANLNPNKAAGPDSIKYIKGTKIRNCSCYLPAVWEIAQNRPVAFRMDQSSSMSPLQKGW